MKLAIVIAAIAAVIGFDHPGHEGKVIVSGKDSPACTSCHAIAPGGTLIGRPGHAACFGSCHGAAPRPGVAPTEAQAEVCAACHEPADLDERKPAVAFPPYRLDPDFGMTLSHALHGSAGASCTSCHRVPAAAPPPPGKPHARCIGCHATKVAAVPMTACATCHLAAFGANASPRLQRGPLAVGTAFDHRRHTARTPAAATGGGALACDRCHRAIAAATTLELPAPDTATCAGAGCHDGAAAFATTVACRRCHTAPPPVPIEVARPDAPFSHQGHAPRLAIDDCASCHRLDARGEPRSTGHAACTACHAEQFVARKPTICGACHASTEPWRPLTVDRMPMPTSDFGASLDHGRHRAIGCERCHSLDTAARQLRPSRGHVACSGSGCHAATGGPAPVLSACAGCHGLGVERARTAERTAAPWSVRARFRHAPHRVDATGAALGCAACHVAGDAAMPAPPAKATCAPCHDGKIAFKMSGHGCARCHGD